ncbi:cytochrome P450 20A1-like [Diadema setosum]|uniref:cytochrome P450 20A1-like n=1 Tax=Diadema setosum TaxID=31175 RepID=UPI003B3B2C88
MLDFAIFAVTFVVFLIALLIYFYPTAPPKATTVPGVAPSDPVKGNLDEIADAGSLHQFLVKLHAEFGDIVSFYYTDQLCVSIASPELYKEHQAVFDRPPLLFQLFEPLITADSIQYANGADGRKRRDLTDRCFGFQALQNHVAVFNKISRELVEKLSDCPPNEHIPLRSTCLDTAMKGITITSFGDFFQDDKALSDMRRDYDHVWGDLESRLGGIMPEPGSNREKEFDEAQERMQNAIRQAIKQRRANPADQGQEIFLDVLLRANYPESRLLADAITYFVGGFHTSGNLFAWAVFFLTQDEKVQEKLADHVTKIVGKTGDVTMDHIADMTYLRQVLDETLRVSVLAPFAARVQDIDVVLGGHVIPKGTPVVHALGVSLWSEKTFPNPEVFNPDNFSAENVKNRHRNAFQPFGFAGRRVCPGQQFAYKEVAIFLAWFVRAFKISLVPGQETEQVFGLVSHVANKNGGDVWLLVERR